MEQYWVQDLKNSWAVHRGSLPELPRGGEQGRLLGALGSAGGAQDKIVGRGHEGSSSRSTPK